MSGAIRILISGFEPFGGSDVNPSQKLIESFEDEADSTLQVKTVLLPVVSGLASNRLIEAVDQSRPDAVIAFGESGRASNIRLERIFINLRDFRIPDNQGTVLNDAPVDSGGPAAYFSTLPVRSMLTALESAGVRASLSTNAGAFLCNEVGYSLMHCLVNSHRNVRGGFVHVPQLPEQRTDDGGWPLADTVRAARILLRAVRNTIADFG